MTTAKMMGRLDPQSTQTEEVAVSPPGLEQLVERVRCRSPFYAEHYRHLATRGWQLKDLPLINPERYWEGSQGLKNWPVLTGPVEDGIVFKTGGTTGGGKLSVFSPGVACVRHQFWPQPLQPAQARRARGKFIFRR